MVEMPNNISSPEEERKKEKVEKFLASPARDREALLVLLGLKPATEIYSEKPEETIETLQKLGLFGEIGAFDKKSGKTEIFVATDKGVLEKFKSLQPDRDHKEYGILMGYPETAVDAFFHPENELPYEVRAEIQDKYPFFKFAFSKDHWKQEEEVLKKWNLALFDYAPEFIDEVYHSDSAQEFKKNLSSIKAQEKS